VKARDEDPSLPKSRHLILLLGLVVAGSSWQFAARSGMAARSIMSYTPMRQERPEPPQPGRAQQVSFTQGLGLARIGVPSIRTTRPRHAATTGAAAGGPARAARGATRPTTARTSTPAAALPPIDAPSHHPAPWDELSARPITRPGDLSSGPGQSARDADPRQRPSPSLSFLGVDSVPSAPGRALDAASKESGDGEDVDGELDDLDDDAEIEVAQEPDGTADPDSGGTQVLVVGPGVVRSGDLVTFTIQVENASNVAHSPLRLVFDPDVLQFVGATEGTFLGAGGTATQFLARESGAAGIVEIALSRMPPARGLAGNGVLCSITFRARRPGTSPIVLAGSSLLDPAGRKLSFRRNDADVAVQ
jgi:hypothetical protein